MIRRNMDTKGNCLKQRLIIRAKDLTIIDQITLT